MTLSDLNIFKVFLQLTQLPKFSSISLYDEPFLTYAPFFRKSAPSDPKWPWHVKGHKYQYACYIYPRGPNFHPFRSTMSRIRVTSQFWKKVHWMTPKWSWHVQDHRYMHMLTTYTPRPKFSSVSFCDEPQVFELWPNIGKSAPNDPQITLTCSRLKAHICILHASSRLKYSPFRSKMSRFRVTPFFPEKCT